MKQGEIAKDNLLMAKGLWGSGMLTTLFLGLEEDPEKRRYRLQKAMEWSEEASRRFQIINSYDSFLLATRNYVNCLTSLARLEVDFEKKRRMLKKAVQIGRESYKIISKAFDQGQIWINSESAMVALCMALHRLSSSEAEVEEKRALLRETLRIHKKIVEIYEKVGQPTRVDSAYGRLRLAITQVHLAEISTSTKMKVELLNNAVYSYEKGLEIFRRNLQLHPSSPLLQAIHYGSSFVRFGNFLTYFYTITLEKKHVFRAIEAYRNAIVQYKMGGLSSHLAETCWKIARLHDLLGDYSKAADNYENAATEYGKASEKVSRLKNFYQDYSSYMRAWSHIERARFYHSAEKYSEAKDHYEEATKLHESSERWSYLAPNYAAWRQLEKAEDLSRKEDTVKAIQVFAQASKQFIKTEIALKTKIEAITSIEEKEMAEKLIVNSELRCRYCQARISIEEGKLLDKKGAYGPSSKNYGEAAKNIASIIQQLESETERKELHFIEFLCRAWEKMAVAEETASSESYLEAAALFEQAKDLGRNKKTSLWALGNSSFCKGLAAGIRYQSTVDLAEHSRAKSLLKSAATSYFQAGFESASEYAKATQRLFDAYVFMNQAEGELNQEKRAKQYQMAEKLLQISAGSFVKAKQPEKASQAQKILGTVREEKNLAISLNEVLHAPAVASTTLSFATPTPTGEASVGLESFDHANVQANLIIGSKKVRVRESFCLTLEFVNAGKEPALLTKIEDFLPEGFVVVEKPEIYRLEEDCLNMKGKELSPSRLVEAKVVLQASRKGVYQLKPTIHYLDELGQQKSLELKSLEITVEEVIISDRVTTGITELDSLLLGGIPEGYAIALTGPPSDSRNLLVKNFLEAGAERGQVTFHVTAEPVGLKTLLDKNGFYLFVCNPKPKTEIADLPNVYKLRSKIDLNNLNIALTKAYNSLSKIEEEPRRACIEIVSDILLHYEADTTRKWLDEIANDLISKGFTILMVMNPSAHPSDQANAILDIFDGEINLYETEDVIECKRFIRIKKLRNQDYIKNSICLTKQT
jgi:KaiC/GvpD/RAD55 family RecA-like ATPase